jgi:hypothetical protein
MNGIICMGLHPRKKPIIKLLKDYHIMLVIILHLLPALLIITHTPKPEFMAAVFHLLT